MAGKPIPALDYLAQPEKYPPQPVCAVFGDESFLRRQAILCLRAAVLGGGDGDFSLSTFEGRGTLFRDVHEVLSTVAMFGGGKRLAVVEDADDFVTRYRPQLEDYVARPSRSGVLVLDLDSLPSNTRLYKSIAAEGLLIDCGAPAPARLCKWLAEWAKQHHHVQLPQAAAEMLVELIGPELGLLDQELAKLGPVGRRRQEDLARVGRPLGGRLAGQNHLGNARRRAGRQRPRGHAATRSAAGLGRAAGGLLGQISASLRRFAAATRLVLQAEAAGRRVNLREALEQAGVRSFVLQKAERQLRLLGRQRGAQLYRWLLQADLDLKGESAMPPRLILERLIVRLSARPKPSPLPPAEGQGEG